MRKNENKEVTHTIKPSPDTGKVSTDRLTEGASVSRHEKKQFLQNDIKYLPVILERSEESGKGYKI